MKLRYALFSLALLTALPSARAASTSELTQQVQALQQLADSFDQRLGALEGALRQNPQLLGLLQEVEALKAELAKMRGQTEVQAHQLDTLDKRQNDLYADLDQRLTALAQAKPSVQTPSAATDVPANAAATPAADPQLESRDYDAALKLFRDKKYAGAIAAFKDFIKTYPDSKLAPNAQYWVGYSYYSVKDYKSAVAHQQKLLAVYPASDKAPDALLNVAASQVALNDMAGAKKTLQQVVAQYPGSPAAALASKRLAAFK
jgi:tol-pal system protein YbgF